MFSRPKRGETEDDLLRLQEEFLKHKVSVPAASVIKRKSDHESESGTSDDAENIRKKHRSKFAASREDRSSTSDGKFKTIEPVVLGDIQEKNMLNAAVLSLPPSAASKQGFPEVFMRDKSLVPTRKSIFAQHVAKLKGIESMDADIDSTKRSEKIDILAEDKRFGDKSFVLTGEDSQKIHEENVAKLSNMTSEDILKEQKKLIAQLDPAILKFVRSRRQTNDEQDGKQDSAISAKLNKSLEKSKMETDVNNDVGLSVPHEVSPAVVTFSEDAEMNVETSTDTNNEENFEKLCLPVKAEEANKWLHMDVLERDKLKWIGDLPSPPPLPANTPYSARFDFQGILLPYSDEKVDVTKALHHHGEEPERPGYTLQEILQLSRSSNLQQRVVALKTLSNILDKTKAGYYDECLDTPLLNQLAESDLYLLLRFSLDDSTEPVITATLLAVRNLLWNEADEVCVDRLLGLWNGHIQPSLMAKTEIKKQSEKEELKEDEVEMKDHQILRLDMIKGTLRTDLMLRLRYILEVLKPGPRAVISVLEILTRIVRHSHDAALAVTCCPRLMSLIITNFVPRDWRGIVGSCKPSEMASVYGVPLVEALKLLRVIASCSRTMASDLVHKFGIMESIISYISIDPRECGLPQKEAVRLSLESLYLWNTLLSYNFATTQFTDMYPIFMRLLQFHLSATSASDSSSTFGHEHGAALMSLFTQAMLIADAQMKKLASQKVSVSQRIAVTVTYEHLSGFAQPISLCLKKWLNQLVRAEEITFTALKLVTASLNCAAVWINKFHSQPSVDSVSLMEELEDLMSSTVQPFLSSSNFKLLCSRIKSSSCLLADIRSGRDRDPSSLPSLGSLVWGGREVMPSISASSPLPLLQGLTHFLASVCSMHRGLFTLCVQNLLDNPRILEYITMLGCKKLHAGDNWFTQVETVMLAHMLKLLNVVLPTGNYEHVGIFHNMAIRLVAVIPSDEKYLVKEIFSQVVFNPDFLRDCSDVSYSLEALKLTDVTQEQDKASICSLLEVATNRILSLWPCYESSLNLDTVSLRSPLDVTTYTASENGLEPAFPNDWSYLPVLKLYSKAFSGKENIEDNTKFVISSLQWLLIVECLRPQSTATISITARFCRLCTVFLAGNDLFLAPDVHHYLDALLRILLNRNSMLNFNEKIPGLSSFYDLYTQLLEQFVSVSYGDELFGHFVLIPLQQRHSSSFRKLVWSEHAAALRVLRTKPEQLAVPLQNFLEPCETDQSLLKCYFSGIMSGQIQELWCPVLYRVALHHVPTFILEHPETTLAQQLKSRIQELKNKVPVQWRTKLGEMEDQEKI